MKFLFEDLRLSKSKPMVNAINRLVDAGVSLEKIAESFSHSPNSEHKILIIADASHLIKEKVISFSRLGKIYECAPDTFHLFCKELQEIYRASPEKYFLLTQNNWDFFTHYISSHKTPKDFEYLYTHSPKKFKKMRSHFI